ncbi:hypothetical protein Tco_1494722 [Tanacetum coccineum]
MKPSQTTPMINTNAGTSSNNKSKPQFRPAIDDSKPLLQDPIIRSDPIETEEAVIRLPHFPPRTLSK